MKKLYKEVKENQGVIVARNLVKQILESNNWNVSKTASILWWKFWTSWYYVNTVWMYWSEKTIREYVKNQWLEKSYKKIVEWQLMIF